MRIFLDADAFPTMIKEILFRAAERVKVPLLLVANQPVRIPDSEYIDQLTVEAGPDVADDAIVEMMRQGDLIITADIPLADRVVSKGGFALNPRGELYTEENIKQHLATRDLMTGLRDSGITTPGPAAYTQRDRQYFANQLDRFLTKYSR